MELIEESQVKKALSALKRYSDSKETAKNNNLLFSDNILQAHFTLKKLPSVITGYKMIDCQLPRSYLDKKVTSICLFTKDIDKRKKRDTESSVSHFKELLVDEKGVTCIDEVISFKQLKIEYRTFEARRKLCSAYDVFLVDDAIANLIGPYLGRCFLEEKKLPFPIKLTRENINNKIDKCLSTSRMLVNTCSSRCSVKFGSIEQDENDLLINFLCAVKCVNEKLPGKLENVRSIDIGFSNCPMLPVYISTGSANAVKFEPPPPKTMSRRSKPMIASFDTFDDKHLVQILPSGDVKLMKKKKGGIGNAKVTVRRKIKRLWTKSVKRGKRMIVKQELSSDKKTTGRRRSKKINKSRRNQTSAESAKKPKLEVKQEELTSVKAEC